MTTIYPQATAQSDSTASPVQVSAKEFVEFLLPPLSLPQGGPQCQSGSHQPFHSILTVLSTGRQWQELPLAPGPAGQAALHDTRVCKLFARWAEEGSRERAFVAAVTHLEAAQKLDLSLLHGAGANTVATKGARPVATAATNRRKASK
jgi:transposase